MTSQVRLLQMLVKYQDLEIEAFNIDGKPLRIEVDDIYFLRGLSHCGQAVNLKARGDGGCMNIDDSISTHFVAGTDKVRIHLPIRVIENLIFKIFILVLT